MKNKCILEKYFLYLQTAERTYLLGLQYIEYSWFEKWNKKTNNLICLDENKTGFNRLSRDTFIMTAELQNAIASGYFVDYHCYRPMREYAALNNQIYDLLPEGP